jgi:hypothetical protein
VFGASKVHAIVYRLGNEQGIRENVPIHRAFELRYAEQRTIGCCESTLFGVDFGHIRRNLDPIRSNSGLQQAYARVDRWLGRKLQALAQTDIANGRLWLESGQRHERVRL